MRVVIQRVTESSVTVDGSVVTAIGMGLVVLLAIEPADTDSDLEWMAGKVSRLRIFDDENGVMNRSVQEAGGEVLVVSQFTLFASTRKGNRPSYSRSAAAETAVPLYDQFVRRLEQELGQSVKKGVFRAQMRVALVNDGPVTIIIDSKLRE